MSTVDLGTDSLSNIVSASATGTYIDRDGLKVEVDPCVAAEIGRKVGMVLATRIAAVIARKGLPLDLPTEMPAPLALEAGRLSWRGKPVRLTASEVSAVRVLAGNQCDVTYRQLYDAYRGPGFIAGSGLEGYRTNVRAAIRRIRTKFQDVDPGFDAIKAYNGFGYRWETPADAVVAVRHG